VASAADGIGLRRYRLLLPLWVDRELGAWFVFEGGRNELNPGDGNRDFSMGGDALPRVVARDCSIGADLSATAFNAVGGRSLLPRSSV
jgi:hypothetical protein